MSEPYKHIDATWLPSGQGEGMRKHYLDRKSETILKDGLAVFLLQIWGKTVVWRKKPPSAVTLENGTRKHTDG